MPKVMYRVYSYVCETRCFHPEKLQENASELETLIVQTLNSKRYKPLIEVYVTAITENRTHYNVKIEERFLDRCKRQPSQLKTMIGSRNLKRAIDIERNYPEKVIKWKTPIITTNGTLVPFEQKLGIFAVESSYAPLRDYQIYQLVVKGELPPLN